MTISTRKFITRMAVVLLSSSPLLASAASTGYKMALIDNAPGAEYIQAGQYEKAIASAQAPSQADAESFYGQVSLCVAYSRMNELDLAATACDNAVYRAATLKAVTGSAKREMRALALNNRGVIKLLAGDKVAALQDFMLAVRLNDSAITAANLERLTFSINEGQEIAMQTAE
ncbi:MAG: hypothetical protein NWQ48_09925 [Alishewanella sp.]|uniref:hypothetical protein n=1 Tax=Alishewanella sp. HL-SH05 TaxID=3461145 RepID=UPI00276D68B5|nr:hypothetical protein [Alishewanella sp.]